MHLKEDVICFLLINILFTRTGKHTVLLINMTFCVLYTDKKENKTFLIYKEIQYGAVEKSTMRKGILIYGKVQIFNNI